MAIIVTVAVGFLWFVSGFLAAGLLRGLFREIFLTSEERYNWHHWRLCDYVFWVGIFGLGIVLGRIYPKYRELGFPKFYFCLRMPKDLREKRS